MTLISRVFSGADQWYDQASEAINNAIAKYGEDQAVAFGDTAYSVPCIYAMLGDKIGTLGEAKALLEGKKIDGKMFDEVFKNRKYDTDYSNDSFDETDDEDFEIGE